MSVTQIYCEGTSGGLDARIIAEIAPRGCLVKPIGSKNRSAFKVVADRSISPMLGMLVDRDFDCAATAVVEKPVPIFEGTVPVGWSWERKEIENYLLDPTIVEKAWVSKGIFTLDDYRQALIQAAERLKFYTAARTALSCFSYRNRWGTNRSEFKSYKFPRDISQQACRTKIEEIVNEDKSDRIVTPANVIQKFEDLLPEFSTSGHRQAHPLVYHSGKDFLLAMKPSLDSWMPSPQSSIQTFLERITKQLEREENVWDWLPEWTELRNLLENTDFGNASI